MAARGAGGGGAGGKRAARTVRLSIELGASNEDRYPELNYRDLVQDTKRKSKVENGKKPAGADPFSDNEDDVARMAKQFEQKYGSMSTYGRKGVSKRDEFADIGAGYDENDSFIDNTDGYDEMFPPEVDTYHGGFYINCGSLEFKSVPEEQMLQSDNEIGGQRSNKRRISSSSSEEESSESSSDSESQDRQLDKDKATNGEIDCHNTDRRKRKGKGEGKNKVKKQRTESAATSGKQTSDDGHGESADSRTSHSDSLTSKPAPSSENAITSDSSREPTDAKSDLKLPPLVGVVLEELTSCVTRLKQNNPGIGTSELEPHTDPYILRLEQALTTCDADVRCRRASWVAAARALSAPRTRLLHRARALIAQSSSSGSTAPQHTTTTAQEKELKTKKPASVEKLEKDKAEKKEEKVEQKKETASTLSPEEQERQISDILETLRTIIEQMKPEIIQTYKVECERIQIENKRIALANVEAASKQEPRITERRLPKRRYPWCSKVRNLLAKLVMLCGGTEGRGEEAAARLLAHRVLPMFPPGFVRLPTLLRQANLNKDLKVNEIKKRKIPPPASILNSEPKLPSSSSITINPVPPPPKLLEKSHSVVACSKDNEQKLNGKPYKSHSESSASSQKSTFNSIFNNFTLASNTDVFLEKPKTDNDDFRTKDKVTVEKVPDKIGSDKSMKADDRYIPPNSIGSITITPVTTAQKFDPRYQASKLANNTVTISAGTKISNAEPSIRIKSPAEIMKVAHLMANKDDKTKSKSEPKLPNPLHIRPPEKPNISPLAIDTSCPRKEITKTHSPNYVRKPNGMDAKKQTDNIPRPGLIPVNHSPTFAKPAEKRPELKKSKDGPVLIVSDVDPLSDVLHLDDSSSDVELVEEIVATKPPDPLDVPDKPKIDSNNDNKHQNRSDNVDKHIQKSQDSSQHSSNSSKHSKDDLMQRDDRNPHREQEKTTRDERIKDANIQQKDRNREQPLDKSQRRDSDRHRSDSSFEKSQKRDDSDRSQRREYSSPDKRSDHHERSHSRDNHSDRRRDDSGTHPRREEYSSHSDKRRDEHTANTERKRDDHSSHFDKRREIIVSPEKRREEHVTHSDKSRDISIPHPEKRIDGLSSHSNKKREEFPAYPDKRREEFHSHPDKRREEHVSHSEKRREEHVSHSEKRREEHITHSEKKKEDRTHFNKRREEIASPEKRKEEHNRLRDIRKHDFLAHHEKRKDDDRSQRKDDSQKGDSERTERIEPHKTHDTLTSLQDKSKSEQAIVDRGVKRPSESDPSHNVSRPKLEKKLEVDDGDFDIDKVMRDLRDLQNSQEPHLNNSSS